MYRVAIATVLACLVLAGCGTGSEQKSQSSARTPSYFTAADTDAINKPANAVLVVGSKATSASSFRACTRIKALSAWRRCWHGLLDPYTAAMAALAGIFNSLMTTDFPDACLTQLEAAHRTFTGYATRLKALVADFDSDKRSEQSGAVSSYGATLDSITKGFRKPFESVTQVCYSAQDLASINATPSASPTAGP